MKRRIPIGLIGMLGLLQSSLVSAIQSVDFSIPATSAVFSDSTCSELAYVSFSANNIQTGLTGDNGVPGSLDVYWILLEDPNGTPIAAVQRSTFSGFNKVDSTGLLYPPTGTNPLTGDYELSLVDVTGTDAFIAFTPEELQQRVADDLAYERPFPAQFTWPRLRHSTRTAANFLSATASDTGATNRSRRIPHPSSI